MTLSATDGENGSGVASLTYSSSGAQVLPATTVNGSTATVNVTAEGTTTVTFSARDNYGNVEQSKTVTVKLDKTAPVVNITSPASAAAYTVGQAVTANFNCNDGGSGAVTCTGTAANGAALNTSTVGAKTFTVDAADAAGNTASKTVSYTVTYGVKSLFDLTKPANSGSTVQLDLQLVNSGGVNISSAGLDVRAVKVVRVTTGGEVVVEQYADNDAGAVLDFQNGQNLYRFKLKTKGYAAGTYLLYFRVGNDPNLHSVEFRLR